MSKIGKVYFNLNWHTIMDLLDMATNDKERAVQVYLKNEDLEIHKVIALFKENRKKPYHLNINGLELGPFMNIGEAYECIIDMCEYTHPELREAINEEGTLSSSLS